MFNLRRKQHENAANHSEDLSGLSDSRKGHMVQKIREGMISDKVAQRILWLTIVFFIAFFGITILSYFFLPAGFLLMFAGALVESRAITG